MAPFVGEDVSAARNDNRPPAFLQAFHTVALIRVERAKVFVAILAEREAKEFIEPDCLIGDLQDASHELKVAVSILQLIDGILADRLRRLLNIGEAKLIL